jgi:hypothetical protein
MRWREDGASFEAIGSRFRRSPQFIERVVGMAQLRAGRGR